MGYDQAYARGYLSWILRYPNLHSAIETCLGPEVLGNGFLRRLEGEDAEERQLAARIVNGINCAPYDQAYARGYLSWLLRYPNLHSAIETCLGPEVLGNGFLRRLEGEDAEERQLGARIVNGINCAPYDFFH